MVTKVLACVVAGAVVAVLVAGLAAFEPWRVFTDSTVEESLPVSAVAAPAPVVEEEAVVDATVPTPAVTAGPVTLARGSFVDAEHATQGVAKVLRLTDGRRFVRLEGLDTSDGPDLHVWLSSAPSGGAWGSYDDGAFVALGDLKANHGSHNYAIPADADLSLFRSVVIWCDRFDVAFGTAAVAPG